VSPREPERKVDITSDACARYGSAMRNINFAWSSEKNFQETVALMLKQLGEERDAYRAKLTVVESINADYKAGIIGSTESMFAINAALEAK